MYRATFGGKFIAVGIAPEYYVYGDKHGYEYINEALAHLETELPNYTFVCTAYRFVRYGKTGFPLLVCRLQSFAYSVNA